MGGQSPEQCAADALPLPDDDAWAAVEALWRSPVLDGVKRRVQAQWPWLPADDVDAAVAEAFEALFATLRKGTPVGDHAHWLSRTARNRAAELMRSRARVHLRDPSQGAWPHGGDPEAILDADERRTRAVAHARRLLPRIASANVRAVMEVVIEAAERELPSLTFDDIAEATGLSRDNVKTWHWRGFQQIARLARAEGLADDDFTLDGDGVEPDEENG